MQNSLSSLREYICIWFDNGRQRNWNCNENFDERLYQTQIFPIIITLYTGTSTQKLSPEKPLLKKSKRSCLFAGASQEWIIYASEAPSPNSFAFCFPILRYVDGRGLKVQWEDYLTRATGARPPKRLLCRGSSVAACLIRRTRHFRPMTNFLQ